MLKVNISVSHRIPKTTSRIWEGKKKILKVSKNLENWSCQLKQSPRQIL